jgi:hypothetical protein
MPRGAARDVRLAASRQRPAVTSQAERNARAKTLLSGVLELVLGTPVAGPVQERPSLGFALEFQRDTPFDKDWLAAITRLVNNRSMTAAGPVAAGMIVIVSHVPLPGNNSMCRIEALCGTEALDHMRDVEAQIDDLATELKTDKTSLVDIARRSTTEHTALIEERDQLLASAKE